MEAQIQHVKRQEGDDRFEVLQVESELDRMRQLYITEKPRRVLEIGCWYGGTLREWLTNGTPEIVVAVDLEHRNHDAYEGWRNKDTTLVALSGDSHDPAIVQAIERNGPYDWVFIDGDHGEYAVRADVSTCLPLIVEGGHMLMHDIAAPVGDPTWPHDWYPPAVVLDELDAEGYEVSRFVDPKPEKWAHGIGVVKV